MTREAAAHRRHAGERLLPRSTDQHTCPIRTAGFSPPNPGVRCHPGRTGPVRASGAAVVKPAGARIEWAMLGAEPCTAAGLFSLPRVQQGTQHRRIACCTLQRVFGRWWRSEPLLRARSTGKRGNMAIFRSRADAEEFARRDPFILQGLVKGSCRPWGGVASERNAKSRLSSAF
jgi:hypothetical protein